MSPYRDGDGDGEGWSVDPLFHVVRVVPYRFLRPPHLRLKLPSPKLPSPMAVYALVLLTYFMVVSGIVYDVIVEPPGIGSTQDRLTGSVRPVVFLPGRVPPQPFIRRQILPAFSSDLNRLTIHQGFKIGGMLRQQRVPGQLLRRLQIRPRQGFRFLC